MKKRTSNLNQNPSSTAFLRPRTWIRYGIAILLGGALACPVAHAAKDECTDPQSQLVMNQCAARDYAREDARLNRNYAVLMAKLESERRSKLREAEQAWLNFRDLQCDFDSDQYAGGTMYSLVRSSCLTQMTKQRNKDLKAMLEDTER